MPIATPREPPVVRDAFVAWLEQRTGARVAVSSFDAPIGGGLSSETFLVTAMVAENPTRLVLRLPPHGDGLFPQYDLAMQARVLEVLHETTSVPVPLVFAYEGDDEWLGAPFLVMHHAEGRVPTDQPSFLATGWIHELAPADQRTMQQSFLATVAHIHRVDWAEIGLDDLARPGTGSPLARDLAWWATYLEWAADGADVTTTRRALAWCEAHTPASEPPPSLLWGDVRMPNVVFDDALLPAAVLDWEMAGIGPAEVDVGWWLAIHRLLVRVSGGDLPGFLPRDAALAWYEAHLGRPFDHEHLHWYETYGALRSAAIMVRMGRLLHDLGILPDRSLQERNPCTDVLDELLA